MTPRPAAHAYYKACEGEWSAPLHIQVTDPNTLRLQAGWLQTWLLQRLARWPRWLGRWTLETRVAYDPAGIVDHTTRFVWMRLPMVCSVERLRIHNDGVHFSLTGQSYMALFPWAKAVVLGQGHVEPCGTKATYTVQWMGADVQQSSTLVDGVVTLYQRGAGFEGEHPLTRR